MKPGDLVFVMGDPARPILGTRRFEGYNRAEIIKHGTPALVLRVDPGSAQLLLGGMQLWVPNGFVRRPMKKGDIVRICMDWSPYHGTIGIVTGLHSYETATVFIPGWGDKHLDCEVLEVISEAG